MKKFFISKGIMFLIVLLAFVAGVAVGFPFGNHLAVGSVKHYPEKAFSLAVKTTWVTGGINLPNFSQEIRQEAEKTCQTFFIVLETAIKYAVEDELPGYLRRLEKALKTTKEINEKTYLGINAEIKY